MARFIAQATHGREDAIVLLTIEGVWLATKGYADDIQHEGMLPLREVITSLLASGGEIWACSACTKPRGITEEHLIEGARIIAATELVAELVSGTPLYTL
jgi:predicted peroxiredoxin